MILIGALPIVHALSSIHVENFTSDGVWDAEEVEAIYGVHHVYSQKKSKVNVTKVVPCARLLIDVLG